MINKDLERFIAAKCPFEMTNGQREVVAVWAGFLLSADCIFLIFLHQFGVI